jgi:hypothetical protein
MQLEKTFFATPYSILHTACYQHVLNFSRRFILNYRRLRRRFHYFFLLGAVLSGGDGAQCF